MEDDELSIETVALVDALLGVVEALIANGLPMQAVAERWTQQMQDYGDKHEKQAAAVLALLLLRLERRAHGL
jgi:hypothetical protein